MKATEWLDRLILACEVMNIPLNENVYSVDAYFMYEKRVFVRGAKELAEEIGVECKRKPHSSRDQVSFKYRGYEFFDLVDPE